MTGNRKLEAKGHVWHRGASLLMIGMYIDIIREGEHLLGSSGGFRPTMDCPDGPESITGLPNRGSMSGLGVLG